MEKGSNNRRSDSRQRASRRKKDGKWPTLPEGYQVKIPIPECPKNHDETEWIAAGTLSFFNDLTLLVASVNAEMKLRYKKSGEGFPEGFKFLWIADGKEAGELLSGPQYVQKVVEWINDQFEDKRVFPLDERRPFPTDLVEHHVCKMFTLMFRVFAIIHSGAYNTLRLKGMLEMFNTTLKHFVFFGIRYNLLVEPDEFLAMKSPMRRLQQEYIKLWQIKEETEKKT